MDINNVWAEISQLFPEGKKVKGKVTQITHFGVFLDIGHPHAHGLIQIVDFPEDGFYNPRNLPPVGTDLEAIVILARKKQQEIQVYLYVE